MSFGPIQFGGLASGLDTGAIIQTLLSIEAQPIQLLESQKASEQNKLSLLGTLEGYVDDLQEKAEELSSKGGFLAYDVTSSSDSAATFSLTGSSATPGSHTLDVLALASADRYAFSGVADADTDLGAGTVSFDYDGVNYSVTTTGSGDSSLNQIASAINAQSSGEVTASVINVGTGATPNYQLVLAGEDTGADYTIDNLTSSVAGLTGATNLTAASNAQVVVDGLTVERSTNVFSDVVSGISFTVTDVTGGDISFSVDPDTEGVKQNVQDFVDAYNKVIGFINTQNSYDPDATSQSDLFGDSALSSVRTTIQNAIFDVDVSVVQADTIGYSTLGLVGVDVGSDGTLSIDDTTFDDKLSTNMEALADLFTDSTDGLMVKLDSAIEGMVDSTTNVLGDSIPGLFDRKEDTINDLIADIDDQIESLELSLESYEATLVAKYSALEELMAGLNAQSQYLSGVLAG